MNSIAVAGAVEVGLIFGFVALGVFLSFRILDFPDLTADGSFPLGSAVVATAIVGGVDPWVATAMATAAGAAAGVLTATLALRFRILGLLAGILTMTALYSINLRIMGKPNIALLNQGTVFDLGVAWGVPYPWANVATNLLLVAMGVAVLGYFLSTEVGLGLRATGANPRMARAQGVCTGCMTSLGLAISNAMVALGGALFAQANGFADVTSGIGTIVIGLASLILGEAFTQRRWVPLLLVASVAGSVVYRLAVQVALGLDGLGLQASDLSLITSILVAGALVLPRLHAQLRARRAAA